MESYEVVQEAVSNLGTKAVANRMGLSTSIVYKWGEKPSEEEDDGQSGVRNPLDRVLALYEITGKESIISWLCGRAGGFFVENPEYDASDVDANVVANTQRVISEFSDVLREVSKAIKDERGIDAKEAKRIRHEWEDLKSICEGFVVACETGAFEK